MKRLFAAGVIGLFGVFATLHASPALAAEAGPSPEVVGSLAPTGRLRAAINLGNVVLAQQDAASGELAGVSVVLARELGALLQVPVEFVTYPSAGMVFAAVDRDEWDIAFLAIEPERAERVSFSQPYVYIDGTYLVRSAAPFNGVADLDRAGVTIAVGRGAAYDLFLTRSLTSATLVRADTSPAAIALFKSGGADAVAGVRQSLLEGAGGQSDLRVLEDRFMQIGQAVAVPVARDAAGIAWVDGFVEAMLASGSVRAALDASGQQAAVVPSTRP